jgi:hypothetical protein
MKNRITGDRPLFSSPIFGQNKTSKHSVEKARLILSTNFDLTRFNACLSYEFF